MRHHEYVWMEKEQCPYCEQRMTNGRLIRHIYRKHTDEQAQAFMEKERHRYDGVFKLLKELGERPNV